MAARRSRKKAPRGRAKKRAAKKAPRGRAKRSKRKRAAKPRRKKRPAKRRAAKKRPAPKRTAKKAPARRLSAADLAKTQREISVAEFFAKNRHLLGYDNPSKALLTVVREAVDNALDACEEAGILPEVEVRIEQVKAGTARKDADGDEAKPSRSRRTMPGGTADRHRVTVTDNGPGIVKGQINKIFGKLLYGSKFHRLRMSRGQQGIGISAAALYGQLTTGKPIRITSKTGPRKTAHVVELTIDTRTNNPHKTREDTDPDFPLKHGTRLELEIEGRYAAGPRSVLEYLRQTALANPHAAIRFTPPGATKPEDAHVFERAVRQVPEPPREIKPHPYGVELGALIKMLGTTPEKRVATFLKREFSRVSPKVCAEILETADINPKAWSKHVARAEAERLHGAMNEVRIMAPPTDCLAPIGEKALAEGLGKEVEADFYTTVTRAPSVYRGNPFQVEVGVAYGGPLPADQTARLYRFANRVPLLYQQGACAITRAASKVSWRAYDLQQPRGSLPVGPLVIMVHIASVWVPFTSESKEAVAGYDEIHKEVRLALQECGRRLGQYVRKKKRMAAAAKKLSYISDYLPTVIEALQELLDLSDTQAKRAEKVLGETLKKSRKA